MSRPRSALQQARLELEEAERILVPVSQLPQVPPGAQQAVSLGLRRLREAAAKIEGVIDQIQRK